MLYWGVDWSEKRHQVCICNESGALVSSLAIEHSVEGFQRLARERQKLGVPAAECLVAIETAHNPVVDYLLDLGCTVYIIPPSSTKGYRERYRSSGAYNDASDAWLLADVVRMNRQHHQPWQAHSALVQQIRVQVRQLRVLGRTMQQQEGQLRAALLRTYPLAVDWFSSLKREILLHLLIAYPTAAEGRALSLEQFKAFCRAHQYSRSDLIATRYAQLQADLPQATAEAVQAYRPYVRRLATLLLAHVEAHQEALRELQRLFRQHPDAPIFDSLPGAGDLLAPALLGKLGEQRERFPTAGALQSLAGTCPVTQQSGQTRHVFFRRGCDREFRHIAQQVALASLKTSTWATAYWTDVRRHSRSDSHATRALANRWLAIIWKLWQSRTPYNEEYHLQQRMQRRKPQA